uniref:Major sperm protein n=1 Tax=Strongyloides venezuelensis TaxID=75913 RepID=A0A0K0FZI5_STRVS
MSAKPTKDLTNKPGEPEFQLKTDPESQLIFKSDDLDKKVCLIKLCINNISTERQIYKIKCTSNEIFRVRPPLGYIPAGTSQTIQIAFTCKKVPESYKHFFAFYHAKSADTRPPKKVWVGNFPFNGVKRMWCLFQKDDGTDFTPPSSGGTPNANENNNGKGENKKEKENSDSNKKGDKPAEKHEGKKEDKKEDK